MSKQADNTLLLKMRFESAHRQWIKALKILCDSRNKDGSWGNQGREWNTFLVVHAFKNKECL
jgi:hypothetical protein